MPALMNVNPSIVFHPGLYAVTLSMSVIQIVHTPCTAFSGFSEPVPVRVAEQLRDGGQHWRDGHGPDTNTGHDRHQPQEDL